MLLFVYLFSYCKFKAKTLQLTEGLQRIKLQQPLHPRDSLSQVQDMLQSPEARRCLSIWEDVGACYRSS